MASGGKRPGAGRPKGITRYGEATKVMRVPESLVPDIKAFAASKGHKLPLYGATVQAGRFTSADSEVEGFIDLNSYIVKNPSSTFLVRASGDSMIDAGIRDGDLLVVDRGIEPTHNKIVIAAIDNQYTVKFLKMIDGEFYLIPANSAYPPIPLDKDRSVQILGVVTSSIQKH